VSGPSGRFHVEVRGTDDHRFLATATPSEDQTPMTPVNQSGLHLSCLLIPDLADITYDEAFAALQTGADRYCRAQFGAGQVAGLGEFIYPTTSDRHQIHGACVTANQ